MVRITQSLLSDRTLFNLQNNINRVARLQDQLATGRRVNRPSDDPIDFPLSLSHRTTINLGQSHLRNINNARSNLDLSEASLNSLTEVLQNVRQLAVQGANETNDAEARLAISDQIKELFGEVVNLANSNFNGRYIFGGSSTTNQPFVDKDGVVLYKGDDFQQQVSISFGATITSNIHGLETFMHTPNKITASLEIEDTNEPLAQQLRKLHPSFMNAPPLPGTQPGSDLEASPNPNNSPSPLPNNNADFFIHGTKVKVDLSVDSLEDVKNRINNTVEDVTASIDERNRLVITSQRSDQLQLQDGSTDTTFTKEPPQGSNLLTALGLNRRVESNRSLTQGFPANDPLFDGTQTPPPERSTVRVQGNSQLFVSANTGPSNNQAVPFQDNLAITDVDADGNELLDENENPVFVNELEAIRVTIDDEVIDIDLRALTEGRDFNGTTGDNDDLPGSDLQDLLNLINNHPQLKGKATAFINDDQTGISISATGTTETVSVSSVRKLFGRDITTRVETDANDVQTISRMEKLDFSTKLANIPGALVDADTGNSLGIRNGEPLPGSETPATNEGFISINNNGDIHSIDLRDAETIGDVIRTINESPAQVTAAINEAGTGINISPELEHDGVFSIMDVQDGTIARDLGLFAPPPPAQIQDTIQTIFSRTTQASTVVPGMSDGDFSLEVRNGAGETLENFTIPVNTFDTIGDIIDRIDAIDGEAGPGQGLISANFTNGTFNIVSNFDGHTMLIDAANDTTGTDDLSKFTQRMGIAQYTGVRFDGEPAEIYSSSQRTAEILGIAGEGTLNEVEEANIFKTMKNLETALRQNDTEGIQASLDAIDVDLEEILTTRTSGGARLNRLDNTQARLEEAEALIRQQLSFVEDADLAEIITELTTTQNAFNASLQASARSIQQTLLNFLR